MKPAATTRAEIRAEKLKPFMRCIKNTVPNRYKPLEPLTRFVHLSQCDHVIQVNLQAYGMAYCDQCAAEEQ